MNEWLAQYFGTAPVSEETTKQAHAELFVKLAMENGIDLNAMSEAEVAELYESTMGKMAEEGASEEDENKKKVEEAKKEHEEKKAAAQEFEAKFAEAQFMGQTMAHAFTAELEAIEQSKTAGTWAGTWDKVKGGVRRYGELMRGGKYNREMADEAKKTMATPGFKTMVNKEMIARGKSLKGTGALDVKGLRKAVEGETREGKYLSHVRKEKGKALAARVGTGVGAAALAGGGAAAVHHATKDRDKESSALDELAAEAAVEKVASAGWNVDEAVDRISAILTLGVDDENSKVAYAQDLSDAIEVRALELAEAAGYPVNWPTE